MHEADLQRITKLQADAVTDRKERIDSANELIQMMQIKASTEMPSPIAPGSISSCNVNLESNLFGVKIEDERTIYRYDVFIEAEIGSKGKRVEFTKKGIMDYIVSDRSKKCITVFMKLAQQAHFFRPNIVFFYDGQSILYTVEQLHFKDNQGFETIIMEGSSISQDLSAFNFVHLSVKPCAKSFQCQVSDIKKCDRDGMKKDRSAMQFCDIATTMNSVYKNLDRFTIFKDGKIFPNRPDLEGIKTVSLKEGKVLIPGMHKTMKLVEGPRGRNNASVAIAVDSLKVAFHEKQKLIDKAIPLINVQNPQVDSMEAFAHQIRGLGCFTMHTKRPRKVEIHGISRENASKKIEIDTGDGTTRIVSVAEYFKIKYDIDLKYPTAPLAMSRERGQINLYPMELLMIIPMQRVTIPQTTGLQSMSTTKECAVGPAERQKAIMDQCRIHGLFDADHHLLKAAGLGIVKGPLQVKGRRLKAPSLGYHANVLETGPDGTWRPGFNHRFAVTGKCTQWAMFGVIEGRTNIGNNDLRKFADALVAKARERGLVLPPPLNVEVLPSHPDTKSLDFVPRMKMRETAYKGCTFMIFVTHDSIAIHKHLKLEERYCGIIAQEIKLKTVMNFLERSQPQTMDNIIFKLNVKLGGLNYRLNLDKTDPSTNYFPPGRLIMGLGVAPAPAPYPLGASTLAPPCVVGYSANMGEERTSFFGDFLYQDCAKEDLLNCMTEVMNCVIDRYIGRVDNLGKRRDDLPGEKRTIKELVIYRSGISEIHYAKCMKQEIPVVRAVLKSRDMDVKLTYIVVQKEHNIRLMPTNIDTKERATRQNVAPGVVVDQSMTHPNYREFFLNSHITLQGTARTPKYTVLADDSHLKMDHLQMLSNALSYNFQIVNSPVSIPAPLYIANRYAERGANMHTAKMSDEMATSNQKQRITLNDCNELLAYTYTPLGGSRINA